MKEAEDKNIKYELSKNMGLFYVQSTVEDYFLPLGKVVNRSLYSKEYLGIGLFFDYS